MRNEDLFHSIQAEILVSLIHRIRNSVRQHQEHIARCESNACAGVIASWYQTQWELFHGQPFRVAAVSPVVKDRRVPSNRIFGFHGIIEGKQRQCGVHIGCLDGGQHSGPRFPAG